MKINHFLHWSLQSVLLLVLFSVTQAQPITPPAHLWIVMNSSSSPTNMDWLRTQEMGALFQKSDLAKSKIGGIVVPVFEDGRTHYETQVVPFKGHNEHVAVDAKALRALLVQAQKRGVPIYLSVDALSWQKNNLSDEQPTNELFAQYPDYRERRQEGVQPQTPEAFYASPWNKEVKRSLSALMADIGRNFPSAAGVVINLSLSQREILGFSDAARFAAINDLNLDPLDFFLQNSADDVNNKRVAQWRNWRREQMSDLLKELRASYTASHPSGRVLVWGTADYYNAQNFNDLHSTQDWRGWLQNKLADGVLLEGRWTPRYNEAETLVALNTGGKNAPMIVPVSDGAQLVANSSFAGDWSALSSRIKRLDTMAFNVTSDADLLSVARLAGGAEKLAPPSSFKVNEQFPDFELRLPNRQEWNTRQTRGKAALALLLNPENISGAEDVFNAVAAEADGKTQFAVVTSDSVMPPLALPKSDAISLLRLDDVHRDLLALYGKQTRLLLIDRAGWVRQLTIPKNASDLKNSLRSLPNLTPSLVVGQKAPDFMMLDMNGQMRHLSELRGQSNLLLTFFPKCFTGGCANHLTSLRDKRAQFEAANTRIWAVSIDPADVQIAFAKSLDVPFPMLPDTGRQLCFLYNATQSVDNLAARMSVLVDKEGVVRWIDTNVDVHTHGTDVLAKMKDLGLG